MSLFVKDLLKDLVRIPSVNPAFSPENEALAGEEKVTSFLEEMFQKQGWSWLRQTVHPGRENIVVVCRAHDAGVGASDRASEAMLWEVHQDTVGIAGMKIDPFAATESEGRVWGRGACDVKGGMAAMLAALVRVEEEAVALEQTIVLAMTINEECGFTGVKALCRLWGEEADKEEVRGPLALAELRALRLTRAIVAEPTSLDVVVAHKGSVRWRCHVHGKAAHSSRPERGCNAISGMAQVVQAIDKYQEQVLHEQAAHTLCGGPTVCVGTIQGGAGVNTVPDHAVIDIDRRLVPGESATDAYESLVAFIAEQTQRSAATIEHELPLSQSTGLVDADNRDWAAQIATTVHALGQPSQLVGVPFGTDAWALCEAGIPTVVFGPGSIDQAHTVDEWIALDQLEQTTEVFFQLAVSR